MICYNVLFAETVDNNQFIEPTVSEAMTTMKNYVYETGFQVPVKMTSGQVCRFYFLKYHPVGTWRLYNVVPKSMQHHRWLDINAMLIYNTFAMS